MAANFNNIFIVIKPVINETISPIKFSKDKIIESDNIEYNPAPAVAGIPIKKLRVKASFLSVLRINKIDVVNPDLLSPGIADMPCIIPVIKASHLLILETSFLGFSSWFFIIKPVAIMNTPMIAVNIPAPFFNISVDATSSTSINIGRPITALVIIDMII